MDLIVRRHSRRFLLHSSSDRKSTRLNSSHITNSYAVFCLKQKNVGHARSSRYHILVPHEVLVTLVVHYECSMLEYSLQPIHLSCPGDIEILHRRSELPVVS